jgi:hypothetical protein
MDGLMIKKIYLDMDGVLADFVKGVESEDFLNSSMKTDDDYYNKKIFFSDKRLFRFLPPTKGMKDLVAFIKSTKIPWEILTCVGEGNRQLIIYYKKKWVEDYVDPYVVVNTTLRGTDKSIFARKNSLLIDDKEKNIKAWCKAGGVGIIHTDVKSTIEYLKQIL